MTRVSLRRDGVVLSGCDTGGGTPVMFQHGLGGDAEQVREIFPQQGFRRLTLECRGHGMSGTSNPQGLSLACFAEDILAFADDRGMQRMAVGGISMGAALALRIAVTQPKRVSALILSRPAWLWDPAPANMKVFVEVAQYLEVGGRATFAASDTGRRLAVEAPDNLISLLRFFDRPNHSLLAPLMKAIASDGPGITEADIRRIAIPTLVIGNTSDWVHPLAYARILAATIPYGKFVEITPKSADKARHGAEFRAAVTDFLNRINNP